MDAVGIALFSVAGARFTDYVRRSHTACKVGDNGCHMIGRTYGHINSINNSMYVWRCTIVCLTSSSWVLSNRPRLCRFQKHNENAPKYVDHKAIVNKANWAQTDTKHRGHHASE